MLCLLKTGQSGLVLADHKVLTNAAAFIAAAVTRRRAYCSTRKVVVTQRELITRECDGIMMALDDAARKLMEDVGATHVSIFAADRTEIVSTGAPITIGREFTLRAINTRACRIGARGDTRKGTRARAAQVKTTISRDGECIGVAEIVVAVSDSELVQTFACAVAAAAALEVVGLPQLAALGYGEMMALDWMIVEESVAVP
jgi:hypothetical protein